MTHEFDADYWEDRWRTNHDGTSMVGNPPNPYLMSAADGLTPGTALDAGCGAGAEAIWLASQGWKVTAADISADALAQASERAADSGAEVSWVEADLTTWSPEGRFDLVTTHYAHASIGQLALYERIAEWVAQGGTLLIVGHLHAHGHHPAEATAAGADIVALLGDAWEITAAAEHERTMTGHAAPLHDVVVQARRLR